MSGRRALLWIFAVVLIASAASNAVLVHSDTFWRFVRDRSDASQSDALLIEARLRSRKPGELGLVFMGNSVVRSDLDIDKLARALRATPEDIEQLWLPAGTGLELAMLTPDLIELAPRGVVVLVTVWHLYEPVDFDRVRLYDAAFAARLLGLPALFHERAAHASKLLASQHVVIRHRDPLRQLLLRNTLHDRQNRTEIDHARELYEQLARAERSDFTCDNLHTRATEQMLHDLRAASVPALLVATPVRYTWGRDPQLQALLDICMGDLARRSGVPYLASGELPEFTDEDFGDELHMNLRGRARFTEALLPALRELLRRP